MNPQLERQTDIFVVRIWREYLTDEYPVLRGEVEDLAKHERHPFADFQELERIVLAGCLNEKSYEEQRTKSHQE